MLGLTPSQRLTVRNGLPDLKVESIQGDSAGDLWIGTHDRGVLRISGSARRVYGREDGLIDPAVYSILIDRTGRSWFATGNGLFFLDGDQLSAIDESCGLSFAWGSFEDATGCLWFGLNRRPGLPAAALCVMGERAELVALSSEKTEAGQSIHSIAGDGMGRVWFGGWHGLCVWDGGRVLPVDLPGEIGMIQALHWIGKDLWVSAVSGMWKWGASDRWWRVDSEKAWSRDGHGGMSVDAAGRIWVTTMDGRVLCYDGMQSSEVCRLPGKPSMGACAIQGNRLWIGTYGNGLFVFDTGPEPIPHPHIPPVRLHSGAVYCMVEAGGEMYGGTRQGLRRIDKESGAQAKVGLSPIAGEESEIMGMVVDQFDRLWVSLRGEFIAVYHGGQFHQPPSARGLETVSIGAMAPDGDGRMWFASQFGYGVGYHAKGDTRLFGNSEGPTFVESMAVHPDGSLWVGSNNPTDWPGLARFDGERFIREAGPRDLSIRAMCFDENGWLFMGTPEGVYVRTGRGIEPVLTVHNDLPCTIITSIVAHGGRLYIGTEGGGFILYDIELKFHVVLSSVDPDADIIHQVYRDPEGRIWLATEGGPLEYIYRAQTLSLTIEHMVAGVSMGTLAHQSVREPEGAALEFRLVADGAQAYRYRLRGHDVHWHRTDEPSIVYKSLLRGTYVLEVEAFDKYLNRAVCTCDLYILPPIIGPKHKPLVGAPESRDALMRQLEEAGLGDIKVLLLGETGTGKTHLAEIIHGLSGRREGPFRAVDCTGIRGDLALSALFGHERGAFTGADRTQPGRFEQAQGGTLFLDEIGDLPPDAQAQILRAIEDGIIERVGGVKFIPVDVRVIAATNKNLAEAVQAGEFRADLFYRINAMTLEIPPLRQRLGDIPYLVDFFLASYAQKMKKPKPTLTDAAWDRIRTFAWPGNVRQLRDQIERAMNSARGRMYLGPDDFYLDEREYALLPAMPIEGAETSTLDEGIEEYRRRRIEAALKKCQGNKAAAAKMLGLKRGNNLDHWIQKYGIDPRGYWHSGRVL